MIKTRRGLDLPISGEPSDALDDRPVTSLALMGADYPGLKPTMEVQVGDRVKAGDLVFTDKKNEGVRYTAPGAGTVASINRGARRAFQSLVIDLDGDDAVEFGSHAAGDLASLPRDEVVRQLIDSGQWTSLRTRPYSSVPRPDAVPASIFVTAIDTRPLAPSPERFIAEQTDAFDAGVTVLSRLTEGAVYVCTAADSAIRVSAQSARVESFSGPHPVGLAGTHIHFLDPVSTDRAVWVVGYQDVIAIGHLFLEGRLFFERVVSLAGPGVSNPRLIRTRLGASIDQLTEGELSPEENRVISGSVLDGRTAAGPTGYLGRFVNQVSVLGEGRRRELLQFVAPGADKFSLTRLFVSWMSPGKKHPFTTSTGGSERAMVPVGTYEEVMPLDILPTQLLRALLVQDVETAIDLGCLELDEEDLALCTFACPGKYEYGPYLRQMLANLEAEG